MTEPINAIFFRNFKNSYIPDILEEIYLKKIYEPYIIGKKDLLIADVGANIGLTSFYFKDYAKEIFAIEPSKQHLEELRTMIDYNKITNITVCPYAISNKNGKQKFYLTENTTSFHLGEFANDKDFEEVETVTFDEFMVRNKLDHLDLLKLDPEGEEAKILTSDGFKEYAPKIQVIVGEWHAWSNMERPQFTNVLRDLGYEVRWMHNTRAACYAAVRI